MTPVVRIAVIPLKDGYLLKLTVSRVEFYSERIYNSQARAEQAAHRVVVHLNRAAVTTIAARRHGP